VPYDNYNNYYHHYIIYKYYYISPSHLDLITKTVRNTISLNIDSYYFAESCYAPSASTSSYWYHAFCVPVTWLVATTASFQSAFPQDMQPWRPPQNSSSPHS
jgi:hypothetical protein